MATLTLEHIPDELFLRLEASAQSHQRSVAAEILRCVEQALPPAANSPMEQVAIAQKLREKTAHYTLTDAAIAEAKNQGRP